MKRQVRSSLLLRFGLAAGFVAMACGGDKGSSPLGPSQTEFKGRVESSSSDRLTVSGVEVRIEGSTAVRRGRSTIRPADLKIGEFVRVQGTLQADGTILAIEIRVSNDRVVFKAKVKSTTPDLELEGIDVDIRIKIDVDVRIQLDCHRASKSEIKLGQEVLVEAILQADGSVLVVKIEISVNVDVQVRCDKDKDGDLDDDSDSDED